MKSKLLFVFLCCSSFAFGQGVANGEWRTLFSYKELTAVAQNDKEIYCASTGGLFSIIKSSGEIHTFSTLDGFAASNINSINWNNYTQQLFILYVNTNIDVLENGKIQHYPEIYNKSILGKKEIYKVSFLDHLAFVSSSFGIVVYDLQRKEVKDTYYFNLNGSNLEVYDVAFANEKIYANTSNGIYEASLSAELANFSNWTPHHTQQHTPPNSFSSITSFAGSIYGLAANNIYKFDGTFWQNTSLFGQDVIKLKTEGNYLLSVAPFRVIVYDQNLNIVNNSQNQAVFSNAKDAVYSLHPFVADSKNGLIEIQNNQALRSFLVQGPSSKNIKNINWGNAGLILSPGGYTPTNTPLFNNSGFSVFTQEIWKNYTPDNYPALANVRDIVSSHQNAEGLWLASYVNGLIKQDGENFVVFNQNNSSLQTTVGDAATLRVSGIETDADGNLWVSQFGVSRPLSVKKNNGDWLSFSLDGTSSSSFVEATGLLIDNQQQKWLSIKNQGIVVFNESSSKNINFATNEAGLPGTNVNAFAKDLNGSIWIGTNKGVAVVNDVSTLKVEIPKLITDGYLKPLLSDENIQAIAIDGNNQKWIGTNNGVWLFNSDGSKQILNFNTKNSPLISNRIAAISIDQNTGEIYFGSDEGLISYKGNATAAVAKMGKIKVYPNPVRPDYKGEISIDGLSADANVKITDISGNLVYETISKGGQAVWNGKNNNGQEVASGVYLALILSADKTDKAVAKIMIIR